MSGWAESATGISIADGDSAIGVPVSALVRLGLRDNPRRLHLLVSQVLGKHVPTDPRVVLGSGRLLGALVDDALFADPSELDSSLKTAGTALHAALAEHTPATAAQFDRAVNTVLAQRTDRARPSIAVLGFAETATALGHAVSDGLPGSRYLHSTRRLVEGSTPLAGFAEEHSHAPDHLLLPDDPAFLAAQSPDEPLVLVDDELSTGKTAANTIAALHAVTPRSTYVVAALVDMRVAGEADPLTELAQRLGVRIDVLALSHGSVEVPHDAREQLQAALASPLPQTSPLRGAIGTLTRIDIPATAVREAGRHGIRPGDRAALDRLTESVAAQVAPHVHGSMLMLGGEELMYAPLRIAADIAQNHDSAVRFSTTTRSPAQTIDRDDYPLRCTLRFDVLDRDVVLASDSPTPLARYGYNVDGSFDTIVLAVDDPCDGAALHEPGGLLDQLREQADHVVLLVLPAFRPGAALPEPLRGPDFGSYASQDVGWLLSDLSDVPLEAPTEEREEAVQSGAAHYAESLPIEYVPSTQYREAFETALADGARDIAVAVGVVAGLIRDARGDAPVFVSLARAGTPVGVLLRRWWAMEFHTSPAHYAISIVRGRGIDHTALQWIAREHDPAAVVFVDGWTGKGAIVRELTAALDIHRELYGATFDPQIAVLADPAGCTALHGTREDVLIPSAALNSTVSGLISRTVLNPRLLSAGAFHGAKFYRQLAEADVSARFLDAISDQFDAVRAEVAERLVAARAADRSVTWTGWAAVERISAQYGIDDVTLVKPGIGETTRVLLRRVPWRVLVREADLANDRADGASGAADPALHHVLLLAQERGVPIEAVSDLPYRCVGLIHPKFARTSENGAA